MVTSAIAQKKYGIASRETEGKYMVVTPVPEKIKAAFSHVKNFPVKNFYTNRDMIAPLLGALNNLINRGLTKQLNSWDGIFNIRSQRGYTVQSLHSWGIAIDVNAATNPLGHVGTLSKEFVAAWKDAGFNWGGDWKSRKDPMHFELANI